MKVLIDNKWKEFEVEFGAPHPDGGMVVESEELRNELHRQLHFSPRELVFIQEDDSCSYILCFYDDGEYLDTKAYKCNSL